MAKILNFPRGCRRRTRPLMPVRYVAGSRWVDSGGFSLLLFVTIPAAFAYLSGAVHVARHDALYAALLIAVWGLYFSSDKLLRTRLGPLLVQTGRLSLIAGIGGFFGGIYWLIFTND